jgi:hypothetical protein
VILAFDWMTELISAINFETMVEFRRRRGAYLSGS